jgi:uncharacterized repeat protein (TIGR03803 family)
MKQSSFRGQLIRGSFYNTFAGSSGRERINSLVLGAAFALLLFAGEPRVGAQVTILHSFGSVAGDGANPSAGLIRAPDGNFYGVTYGQAGKTGANGTVFQMTPAGGGFWGGALRVIKRFAGQVLTNPLLYHQKKLIGVEYSPTNGNGALFAVTGYPDGPWRKHFWHQFGSTAGDGINPRGGLIVGSDGNLYGTTFSGGSTGKGTIYKVNPKSHNLTVVYSFPSIAFSADVNPDTALLQATNGNFYGGTEGFDSGAIFVMTPDGQVAPFVTSFCCNQHLTGPLIQGSDGNFYGTAGGPFATFPDVVFQLTPTGGVRALYYSAGVGVTSGVIQGPNGNLYALISSGGTAGKGFVLELSTDAFPPFGYNVLHNFGDGTVQNDGEYPVGTLVVGSDNNLYGTTSGGGSAGLGTVFRISP